METFKCSKCHKELDSSETYEYRGAFSCEEHFDEVQKSRDFERQEVMEETNASVLSQRNGEFISNRSKYHLGNVASDGLPIIKVKESPRLRAYEGRP